MVQITYINNKITYDGKYQDTHWKAKGEIKQAEKNEMWQICWTGAENAGEHKMITLRVWTTNELSRLHENHGFQHQMRL